MATPRPPPDSMLTNPLRDVVDTGGDAAADPSRHADAAEEVRAWFVATRGGAAFLSSADADALLTWLESGIPVTRIVLAVEKTAERRRARRTRAPFSLRSVGAELRRLGRQPETRGAPEPQVPAAAPNQEAAKVLAAIRALPPEDPETRIRAAWKLARTFHDAVWNTLGEGRSTRIAAAAEELADQREPLGEEAFQALCEESARDRVRSAYPELSATALWQELNRGMD